MASQLQEDIKKEDSELISVLQSAIETSSVQPSMEPSDISKAATRVQQQVNAVQGYPVQLEIIKLLQHMQQSMVAATGWNSNNNNNGQRNHCRQPPKTPDNMSFNSNVTDTYCWTHRACGHTSAQCNSRAPGYQDTATLENRLGGSNEFCDA